MSEALGAFALVDMMAVCEETRVRAVSYEEEKIINVVSNENVHRTHNTTDQI